MHLKLCKKLNSAFLIQLHYFYSTKLISLEVLGYFGALLIGVILGITGGGGSILTVPTLVYILNYNPIIATAYSLFIVGQRLVLALFKTLEKGLLFQKRHFYLPFHQ